MNNFCKTLAAAAACSIWASHSKAELSTGDLIITEFLADPSALNDDGEFFEIFNTTDSTINLNGLTFTEDDGTNESFTVIIDAFVNPGEFFVLGGFPVLDGNQTAAQTASIDLNFEDPTQATIDGATAFFSISNGTDEIEIFDGDTEIFSLTYTDGDEFGADDVSAELADITLALDGVVSLDDSADGVNDFVASTTAFDTDGIDALASPGSAGNTVVPEPASAALIGLGSLLISRRRR